MSAPTPAERAELRALAEAATPPPWSARREVVEDLHWGPVGSTLLDGPKRNLFAVAGMPLADAEFIAAARTAVPALLDALEERDCGASGCRAIADRDAEEARAERAGAELARYADIRSQLVAANRHEEPPKTDLVQAIKADRDEWAQRCLRAEAELARLREGVTALADGWVGFDDSHHYGDAILKAIGGPR